MKLSRIIPACSVQSSPAIKFLLCIGFVFLLPVAFADAGIMLSDVKANGVTSATAAYANIAGNDATSGGDPLLGLLNDGGSGTFFDDGSVWTISSGGMFSSAGDLTDGTPLGSLTWSYIGKSDQAGNGPFTSNPAVSTGTITLDTPLFANSIGNIAISLKANNAYSVFAFKDVSNVSHFTFNTQSIVNFKGKNEFDLSHASLFTTRGVGSSIQSIPEPASIFWAVGMLGIATFHRVRRP